MTNNTAITERQLVVFNLGDETYGVDIATVREIIRMQEITAMPGTETYVKGIINLRGMVIPVVDLRQRFRLNEAEYGKETRIVVLDSGGQEIGVIVDSVAEVLRISSDAIEHPSSIITTGDSEYLLGIVKLTDRLVILLNTERVLSREIQDRLASKAVPEEMHNNVIKQGQGSSKRAKKKTNVSRASKHERGKTKTMSDDLVPV